MFKPEFLTRLGAVVLGIQLTAWSLSVGTAGSDTAQTRIPLTPTGIESVSLSASPVSAIATSSSTSTDPSHFVR